MQECKNCDRTFKHKSQLTAHLAMHKVCSYEGCTFSAIPKVLREHVEKVSEVTQINQSDLNSLFIRTASLTL